ncbi:MAG: MFS transporter, partial [Halobacteria archaeon]|nr:MFS transporter [Halobacteria archaeon]
FALVFGVVIFSGLYYRGILTFLPDLLGGTRALSGFSFSGLELEPSRYVYSGLLMVGIAGQYVGGRLTEMVEVEKGVAVGYGTLGVVALAFIPALEASVGVLLLVSAVLGFFLFVVQPLYQATIAEYTPPDSRGVSYGYTYLGVFGIGALGAAVTGYVLTYYDSTTLFVVLALFGGAASLPGVYLSVTE